MSYSPAPIPMQPSVSSDIEDVNDDDSYDERVGRLARPTSTEQFGYLYCLHKAALHGISVFTFVQEVLVEGASSVLRPRVSMGFQDYRFIEGYFQALWELLHRAGAITFGGRGIPVLHPAFERSLRDEIGRGNFDDCMPHAIMEPSIVHRLVEAWLERKAAAALQAADSQDGRAALNQDATT